MMSPSPCADVRGSGAAHNPFSSARVSPGALPFLPPDLPAALLDRLHAAGGRGAVIGPRGAGKSTLLAHVARLAAARGARVLLHRADAGAVAWPPCAPGTSRLLLLDEAGALGRLARFRLFRRCAREGVGLLAAAHRDIGLPVLHRADVDLATARALVARLLAGSGVASPGDDHLAALLRAHHGDLRLVLFTLYDHYERGDLAPAPAPRPRPHEAQKP